MKVVFLGTGEFAVPALEAVHRAGHQVSLVVSQPDRPQGRGLTLRPTPVKTAALALGLRVFQPGKLPVEPEPVNPEKAHGLVGGGYGQILREKILECARWGAVNVHASLLPKYRGAAPIQWAIANGEVRTGVTTMQLDRGMDTGPILLQKECAIEPDDTTATLEPRLAALGSSLLIETLDGLAKGTLIPRAQDESLATRAPLIRKADGHIEFHRTAVEIATRLRGFSPWPGVQFLHLGRPIKILAAAAGAARTEATPIGTVLGVSREGVDVACGGGSTLRLVRVQPESRGPVSAFDFANGAKLKPGTILGAPHGADPASRPSDPKD